MHRLPHPALGEGGRALQADAPSDIALCSIVKSELLFGARKSAKAGEDLARLETFFWPFTSLPFDDHAAELAAHVRAELDKAGTLIGPNDLLIGSIALVHGLTLITHNTREFIRIAGLRVEDWTVRCERHQSHGPECSQVELPFID